MAAQSGHKPLTAEPKDESASCQSDLILAAALELFAARGFACTDVQEIADRVGIGKGTIYRHFGNKESLFLATVRYARRRVQNIVDPAARQDTPPLERLRSGIETFISFFDEHPEIVELLIQERAHFRDRQTATFFEPRDEQNDPWTPLFKQLVEDGVFRDLPLEQIKEALSRFVFGAMFVNYFAGRKAPVAQQCHEMLDVLLHGLLAEPDSKPCS